MNNLILHIKSFLLAMKNDRQLFFERLIRLTVYLGVLVLPLFFIPISSNLFEYSKVILFYGLTSLAVFFWVIKVYLTKKIKIEIKFLDILFILLVSVYFLSSLFAVDTFNSLFGKNLNITNSFLSLSCLVIFYFIVSRFIVKIKQIKTIFVLLIVSVLVLIISNLIPASQGFTFGLSINSLNLLLIFSFVASGILFLQNQKKFIRYSYLVLSLVFLLSLYFLDNQYILLLLALAIFIFIFLLSFKSNYFPNILVVSLTLLLFVTVIVLILPINTYTGFIAPMQFNLPNQFAWEISKATLSDNLLFAAGPQNFIYSFYKYKPVDYNLSPYWQLGFTKSSNFWLEILTTCGLIAVFIFMAIYFKIFQYLARFIKTSEINGQYTFKKYLTIVALSVFISISLIWGFFANFNFIILYFLFLFIALATSLLQVQKQIKVFTNKNFINLFCYLLIILVATIIYFIIPYIKTDINFEKIGTRSYQSEQDFDQTINYVEKIVEKNPQRLDYHLKLANLYINKLAYMEKQQETEYKDVELEENIFSNLDVVLNSDNEIIDNYLGLRQAYNALTEIGYKVLNEREQVNNKLLKLDPNNPELYIDRALINFTKYRALNESGLEATDEQAIVYYINQMESDIKKSLELKEDFVLGYYNLGLYWQELGDQEQALQNIYKAYTLDPSQQLIVLSLKKLYLNQDKVDEAITVLQEYLEAKPDDYQVRAELAVIYKNQNQPEKAKEEINKILEQDPDNEIAKQLLLEIE